MEALSIEIEISPPSFLILQPSLGTFNPLTWLTFLSFLLYFKKCLNFVVYCLSSPTEHRLHEARMFSILRTDTERCPAHSEKSVGSRCMEKWMNAHVGTHMCIEWVHMWMGTHGGSLPPSPFLSGAEASLGSHTRNHQQNLMLRKAHAWTLPSPKCFLKRQPSPRGWSCIGLGMRGK